jgi:hypothetical protein
LANKAAKAARNSLPTTVESRAPRKTRKAGNMSRHAAGRGFKHSIASADATVILGGAVPLAVSPIDSSLAAKMAAGRAVSVENNWG